MNPVPKETRDFIENLKQRLRAEREAQNMLELLRAWLPIIESLDISAEPEDEPGTDVLKARAILSRIDKEG